MAKLEKNTIPYTFLETCFSYVKPSFISHETSASGLVLYFQYHILPPA